MYELISKEKVLILIVWFLIHTLPLHDFQTLTQHPPVQQWLKKNRMKDSRETIVILDLYVASNSTNRLRIDLSESIDKLV